MTSPDNFQFCADIWVDVEFEIDRTALTVRQILELDQNSLIKLSHSAGETLGVFVGGAHVGQGEVVVADQSVAIRIAELREED